MRQQARRRSRRLRPAAKRRSEVNARPDTCGRQNLGGPTSYVADMPRLRRSAETSHRTDRRVVRFVFGPGRDPSLAGHCHGPPATGDPVALVPRWRRLLRRLRPYRSPSGCCRPSCASGPVPVGVARQIHFRLQPHPSRAVSRNFEDKIAALPHWAVRMLVAAELAVPPTLTRSCSKLAVSRGVRRAAGPTERRSDPGCLLTACTDSRHHDRPLRTSGTTGRAHRRGAATTVAGPLGAWSPSKGGGGGAGRGRQAAGQGQKTAPREGVHSTGRC